MVSLIHHEDLMIKPKDHPDDATTSFLTGFEKERNASAFASFLHLVKLGTLGLHEQLSWKDFGKPES